MLLPVALLLFGMGAAGFFYARNAMLAQWGEAALLKLEWAAHQIDMRLSEPKRWLALLQKNTTALRHAGPRRDLLLHQLRSTPGVVRVDLTAGGEEIPSGFSPRSGTPSSAGPMHGGRHFMPRRLEMFEITQPLYDPEIRNRTVSLISDIRDRNGASVGRIEVVLSFDYLMQAVEPADWWQSQKAFLTDRKGRILAGAGVQAPGRLGGTGNPLELETIRKMKDTDSGTLIGPGHPPSEVSGFYRLKEAPWYLVLIAPGQTVLTPILQFRLYYFITAAVFIFFILILIRIVTGRTTAAIKEITAATRNLAEGAHTAPLKAATQDEVGELIHNFNIMNQQLEERMRIKQSLELAEDVQRNLLPKSPPTLPELDIAGTCLFCDEIGGDYYDYIDRGHVDPDTVGIAVGDVSDHGIPSALLMATVRAMLREHMALNDDLGTAITDINRHLCADVENSGRFVTLFYADINGNRKEMRWIRAGHDAAFLYDIESDTFTTLSDKSLPLGVSENAEYKATREPLSVDQILIIGTDGIWEMQNPEGEFFGKDAFYRIIKEYRHAASRDIIAAVLSALKAFRKPREQTDDVTLVVARICS